MGEEEEGAQAQAQEEAKKPEEAKPDKKEEGKKPEKAADEEKKAEESKDGKESNDPPPPPPEIELKVYMHCEGCARKVRRSLKGFDGVEEVTTDCRTHKVVVKGEKADPVKVLERVQKKSHRQVELLSPIPKPPAPEDKKPEEKEVPKPQEKKEEPPQVITVVLSFHMHCDACAHTIKKRILRMKGVESAEPDLKSSQVTVKGVFEPPKLLEFVHKRTGKHAAIVKQEPAKKEEEKAKGAKEEKKTDERGGGGDKKREGESKEKKEGDAAEAKAEATEENMVVGMKKNEYYYYPSVYSAPRYVPVDHYALPPPPPQSHNYHHHPFGAAPYNPFGVAPYNPYPPEMFSDENPNACSVM